MSPYRESARDSLADLDAGEKRVLTELVRLMVRSDGELTEDERDEIAHIADEVGEEEFWKLMDASASSGVDEATVFGAAEAVGSKDAQELIYGALYELSIRDSIDAGENDMLERLQKMWDLEIEDVP